MNTATRIALALALFTASAPLAASASPGPGTSFYFVPGAEMIGTATVSAKPAVTMAMSTAAVKPAEVKSPAARQPQFDQINADARRAAFRHLGTSL